jgi:hypothetical protein
VHDNHNGADLIQKHEKSDADESKGVKNVGQGANDLEDNQWWP